MVFLSAVRSPGAGVGVIHLKKRERGFARDGGRKHGFQLWVNLPKRDKMTKPRYQAIPRSLTLE
jgi:redox-sensitive bicupin YhaK (pirin superfamily)